MLFNSPAFLFVFLPLAAVGFAAVRRWGRGALVWLVAASLVFYARWSVPYLGLLVGLMAANYGLGRLLAARRSRALLAAGIALDLGILAYFKYADFLIGVVASATGIAAPHLGIILPLGISFFIFQKIAYLVDVYGGRIPRHGFLDYCLFVSFFPQLIAGPIVHAREIVPQFRSLAAGPMAANLAVGGTIFVIGLAKKMALADTCALAANPVFDEAVRHPPHLAAAWLGALAYGLQIYFDFSGYSDMAIGLARIFGIVLPVNFASPYKAASIVEFWRRWHITLSRFLRDYVYIPLGGNRRGRARRYANLLATMVLGGIWHGAGWNFILWGALQGAGLAANQAWREFGPRRRTPRALGWIATFLFVIVLWVPFRAAGLDAAGAVWAGMLGLNGVSAAANFGIEARVALALLPAALLVALVAPNTQTLMRGHMPVLEAGTAFDGIEPSLVAVPPWRPSLRLGILAGVLLALCILKLNDVSAFIYFQF